MVPPLLLNVTKSELLSSHFAYNIISCVIGVEKSNNIVNSGLEYQPSNECILNVGSSGCVTVDQLTTYCGSTLLHPLLLNVTVLAFSHCAYRVTVAWCVHVKFIKSSHGLYDIPFQFISVFHPLKAYHSLENPLSGAEYSLS